MRFELRILGSNSAFPSSKRFPTAQVLNIHERFFLIDCGEGTQIRMRKYKISFSKINHIFISHLHGDHFFGLLGLLSSFSLLGRQKDIHIYAHPKLKEFLDFYTQFVGKELDFLYHFHCLSGKYQLLYEDEVCTIHAFPVNHGRMPCSGFIFKEKMRSLNLNKEKIENYNVPISWMERIKQGEDFITANGKRIRNNILTFPSLPLRSYAYCADTVYHEAIIKYIKGVDLLYHEATFSESEKEIAINRYHSTARQAAQIAKLAVAKKLLLGHFSAQFKRINDLVEEAKSIFINTKAVNDGDLFKIAHDKDSED